MVKAQLFSTCTTCLFTGKKLLYNVSGGIQMPINPSILCETSLLSWGTIPRTVLNEIEHRYIELDVARIKSISRYLHSVSS